MYMGMLSSIFALLFLNIAIAHMGPVRAGASFYLVPVFTALLGLLSG